MNFIMFFGALQSIPTEVYEAAILDGCNKMQEIRYISVPYIRKVLFINILLSVSGSIQVFEIPYIMLNGSNGTLTPVIMIQQAMGDNKVGLQARLMSQALRKLTANISKTNTCCIFINQLREKIGVMFGNPETTTGGNALKFYASVRLDVRKTTQIKDGDEATGNRTRVKVVKNKMAPPFKKAEFDIVYGVGISHVSEVCDLAVEFDIIHKSGSWFSYNGEKMAQGREAVKQLLIDNQELCEEIEAKIREQLTMLAD